MNARGTRRPRGGGGRGPKVRGGGGGRGGGSKSKGCLVLALVGSGLMVGSGVLGLIAVAVVTR